MENNKLIFISGKAYSGIVPYAKQLAIDKKYELIDIHDIITALGQKELNSERQHEQIIEVLAGLATKFYNKLVIVNTKHVDILHAFATDIETLPDYIWLEVPQQDRFFRYVEKEQANDQAAIKANFTKFMIIEKREDELGIAGVHSYCVEWGRVIKN